MGKKKPFIDRKNASTFHLMHRSQRDVSQHVLLQEGDTQGSAMILWPSPHNNPETNEKVMGAQTNAAVMKEWRDKLQQAGLLDDGQDEKYLKEITGTGTFLNAAGRVSNAFEGIMTTNNAQDLDMLEVKGQMDNIPLNEALDDEIAQILYSDNFDESAFEELNDEFVLDAAKEPENEGDDAFDYDEHIRQLMEKARLEREATASNDTKNVWAQDDRAFFSRMKPLHERHDDDDDDDDSFADIASAGLDDSEIWTTDVTPGVVPKLGPDEERALCEKFAQTLLEYDSDEIGDDPYQEIGGDRPLEGDAIVEAALDDFLAEKEDDFLIHGSAMREERRRAAGEGGGSGYTVLVGTRMVPIKELDANPALEEQLGNGMDPLDKPPVQEVLAQAQARLQEPHVKPPPEDVLIDGKSYFSEKIRNPWDCESILSTYSNLDNNPVTIGAGSRRRGRNASSKKKQKNANADEEEPIQQIQLSNKTGLPLGVLPSRYGNNGGVGDGESHDDDNNPHWEDGGASTTMSVNRGLARQKNETAEEKRARKAALKQERQMARLQKKVTRQVFQEEFAKRSMAANNDDIAGNTVFRYT